MKRICTIALTMIFLTTFTGCAASQNASKGSDTSSSSGNTNATNAPSNNTNEILVGVLMPNSGDAVNAGSRQRSGMELYIENYNKAGGIKSLNGAKITMVLADTTSKPDVAVTEMERLIQQKKVSCVIGPYQSAVGAATAPIAEKYKIPYVLSNSVADEILQKGYEYVFRANHSASNNAVVIVETCKSLGEKTGKMPKTFALIAENTDWGKGTQVAVEKMLKEKYPEAEVVLSETYPANTADMSSIINKIKAVNPDVVVPMSYLNDALLLTQQMADYKLSNTIVSSGSGFVAGDYIEKAGKNSEYIMGSAAWTTGLLPFLGKEAQDVNEQYKAKMGYDLDEFSANGYLTAAVMVNAIERAASTDPEAIKKALLETDIKPGSPELALHPYKGVKFGDIRDMHNQNIHSEVVMVQILNGKFEIIYPLELIGDNNPAVFPAPIWDERK